MKKIFIIILLIIRLLHLHGQKPWIGNNDFLLEYLKKYPYLDSDKVYYRIPVTFWSYGYPPISSKQIKHQMQNLNKYFTINHTGIRFYLSDIIQIAKRSKNTVNYVREAPFLSTFHRRRGTMNVHFVRLLVRNNFGKRNYYSGVHNKGNKAIVLSMNISENSLSHETGHFLGLEHPHRNWNKGKRKQECVSRTRTFSGSEIRICEVNGDGLRDTPAEPNLLKYTDDSCNYIGSLRDKWGDLYHPDTHNIMSYTKNKSCRYKFTTMQIAVMLYTAEHKPFSEYWKASAENLHYSFDRYEPDNMRIIATALQLDTVQYHTFHKSFISPSERAKDADVDWFIFNAVDSTQYTLWLDRAEHHFPQMSISIFKVKQFIDTLIVNSPTQIDLTLSGYYFFKIEKTEPMPQGTIYDYQILITKTKK